MKRILSCTRAFVKKMGLSSWNWYLVKNKKWESVSMQKKS